jgi:hypothetical protein
MVFMSTTTTRRSTTMGFPNESSKRIAAIREYEARRVLIAIEEQTQIVRAKKEKKS